ncbi:reverse transcriptase domain-containing protein [Tanacetum coccineum]|uniref:Reverse transcriptase domain-containing protein n=1 Tax=Tanacetum coccineum TaxID=301880 RepID=A0ABQ5FFS6_9ASTR
MPSHIASYDGKGDPDNLLHLFEGAIRMQKWLMPVACHMFTYTLKDSARIWWNSQKTGSILNYEDLKAKSRSHFSQQKKFTKTHLAVHNIKQREGKSTQAFITRYTDDTLQILGLHEEQRILGIVHGIENKKFGRASLHEHTIPLTKPIEESEVNSSHREGCEKLRVISKDVRNKKDKGTAPAEAPILMLSQETHIAKSLTQENTDYRGKEIIFPPAEKVNNTPVIIEAKIFGRKVGRVYMDSGSSCEISYKHCFEKLNPTIKAAKVDLKTPLVVFSGERSWSIGKVLLEITIGDAPLSRTETLNFVIIKSDSSHNMLLGRTSMQRMGIVVQRIHQ